jgi:hypothetical protein
LIEVVLSMFLLGIVSLVLFEVFRVGTGYFRVAVLRQGSQGSARRALTALERSLLQAYPEAISLQSDSSRTVTVNGATFHRDALCMPDLSDWSDLTLFNPAGMPMWNRYTVVYATRGVPVGQLAVLQIDPGGAGVSGPWAGFVPALLSDVPPPVGGAVVSRKVLAQEVLDFTVTPDGESYRVDLRLRGQATGPTHGPQRVEDFQLTLRARPQNKLP